jgi:uncharacterized protein YcbK (DUF882 family)
VSITVARRLFAGSSTARSGYCAGLSALLILFGCQSLQNATAEGDTRTISFHHMHTGEDLTVTYKVNGRYDPEAMKKINWELRDWRKEEAIEMDPHLIDILWEVRRDVGTSEPIWVVCGYRSPATNSMLRRRSNGVAKFSQHMLGKATDFYIPGVPLEQLRAVGLYLERGGVGFYPTSGSPFVHLDTGSVRHWPGIADADMPRWLAKGKELHAAAAAHPVSDKPVAVASAATHAASPKAEVAAVAPARAEPARPVQMAAVEKPAPVVAAEKPIPMPASRPVAAKPRVLDTPAVVAAVEPAKPDAPAAPSFELASISSKPVKLSELTAPSTTTPRPAQAASLVAPAPTPAPATAPAPTSAPTAANGTLSAADIIGARGFWSGLPDAAEALPAPSRPGAPARGAAPAKRSVSTTVASADPEATGSLPPLMRQRQDSAEPATVGALAYAAPTAAPVATRASAMGANLGRSAQPDTSVAVKRNADRPSAVSAPIPLGNPATALKAGDRVNDPWLRAMILTPSLNLMSTSMLSKPDYRNLTPFMQKPSSAVMMTFSDDPYLGMGSEKFGGSAVVFVSTTTFGTARTASLR